MEQLTAGEFQGFGEAFQTEAWPSKVRDPPLQSHTNPAMAQQQQRRQNWGVEQDNLLWSLYEQNLIDPHNNTPDYCFNITQQYFPDFCGNGTAGRNHTIRRLRDKNNIRIIQLRAEGARGE